MIARRCLIAVLITAAGVACAGQGSTPSDASYLRVDDSFLELRTGPGRGYPAFFAAEKGERLRIVKRKNYWFKLQTDRGRTGWVHLDRLRSGRLHRGDASVAFRRIAERFERRRFEGGFLMGKLGGAASLGGFAQLNLVPRVGIRASAQQLLGRFSDGWMASADVVMSPFPAWRVAPFFALGSGVVKTTSRTRLVQSNQRTDEATHVAAGIKAYVTRRFVMHAEFDDYIVLTNRDDNEEIRQWQLGFSVFF